MVSFHALDSALDVRHRHEVLRIEAWGPDSARVRAAQFRHPAENAGALPPEPPVGKAPAF